MAQKQNSTTLFRFKTLRVAERSATEPIDYIRTASEYQTSDFDDYSSLGIDALKNLGPGLYEAGVKLLKVRQTITITECLDLCENLPPLTEIQQESVWKEFFFQSLKKESLPIREVAYSILYANHVTKKVIGADMSEADFRKVLNVRILMPKDLFPPKKKDIKEPKEKPISLATQNEFELMKSALEGKERVAVFERVLKEVVEVIDIHKKEEVYRENQYRISFEEELNKFEDAIAEKCFKTEAEREVYMASIKYPTSQFKLSPIDWGKRLYSESLDVLKYLRLLKENVDNSTPAPGEGKGESTNSIQNPTIIQLASEDQIVSTIKAQIQSNYTPILLVQGTTPYTSQDGLFIPVSPNPALNLMTYRLCPMALVDGYKFTLTILLPLGEQVQSVSYELKDSGGTVIASSTHADILRNSNGSVGLTLFPQPIQILSTGGLSLLVQIGTNRGSLYGIDSMVGAEDCVIGKISEDREGVDKYHAGVKNIGIADYRRVDSYVCCYVPGEVAHIENIMAREIKERNIKSLHRSEVQILTDESSESEKSSERGTSERHEMNSEISSMMQESKDFNASTGARYDTVGTGWSVDIQASLAYHASKEEANRQSIADAKEVTERASDRIVSKKRRETTTKMTDEYVEETKHGFDNRQGENHISGVLRFVDKIYKNEIHNYGKRVMFEFGIPEPARLHRLSLNDRAAGLASTIELPQHPKDTAFRILSAGDITETNYKSVAALYRAMVEPLPVENLVIGKSYSSGTDKNASTTNHWNDFRIPDGYLLSQVDCVFNHKSSSSQPRNLDTMVNVAGYQQRVRQKRSINGNPGFGEADSSFGWEAFPNKWGFTFPLVIDYTTAIQRRISDYSMETIPVSIVGWDLGSFALNVTAKFERGAALEEQWKIKTFDAIMAAYEERMREYREAQESAKRQQTEKKLTNPLFYREIERNVLRKNCVEYLVEGFLGALNFQSGINLETHKIERSGWAGGFLDHQSSYIKFIEQAFEWDIMSYQFYPFYWAHRGQWSELYNFECDDKLFAKFMQAGHARVIVTVRPGFENAVNWFMATGELWDGADAPVIDDDLYLSIVEELMEPEYKVEGSWETRIPSNLTVLQKGVIGLNTEGLPCMSDCLDGNENWIVQLPQEVLGDESFPPLASGN